MLKEEEQRRRERFTKDKREEKMGDMLEELVERNPDLLDYLDEGEKIDSSGIDESGEDYTAPFYPDTLEIIESKQDGEWVLWDEDEQGRYETEIALNRNGWVRLYLNAHDDFFIRDESPGELAVQPQEAVKSWGLSKGQLSLQLQPLEAATEGMTLPVSVKVTADKMDALTQEFNISYVEADESESRPSGDGDIPPVERLDFPEIYTVWKNPDEEQFGWDEPDFPRAFDENTPVQLVGSGEDMQIFVNFDAAPIQNFLSRYNLRKTGKETVKETWKVGVAMYAISTYIEIDEEFGEEEIDPSHMTEVSMRGVVQSMLDQQVSENELEALTV
jgi:hypothetical protein